MPRSRKQGGANAQRPKSLLSYRGRYRNEDRYSSRAAPVLVNLLKTMESSHQNPQAVTVATPITSVLLDKKTLSARLGLSPRTLEKMVKDGEFPPGVRVGRFLYWTEAVVVAWKERLFASQHTWNPVLA